MAKSLGRSMLLVGSLTLLQKCFGFLREILMARTYGTSIPVDALSMANGTAEIFMGVTTAFAAAYLPVYAQVRAREGEGEGWRFTNQLLTLVSLIGLAVGSGVLLLAGPILSLVAPGFSGEVYTLSLVYLRFTAWGILFSALTQVFCAALNYREAYLSAASVGLLVSPVQALVILFSLQSGPKALALVYFASGLVQLLAAYLLTRRYQFRLQPRLRPAQSLRPVFMLVLPAYLGSAIGYLNLAVDKYFASYLKGGQVSALNYGFEFRQILLMLFMPVITSIIFPLLSKAAQENPAKVRQIAAQGVDLILILFLPLTAAIFLLAEPVIRLIYEGGTFDVTSVRLTAGALSFYCLSLLFAALRELLTRVYYSIQYTEPIIISWFMTMVVNISGNVILAPRYGANGLALATSISVLSAALVLYFILCWKLGGLYVRRSVRLFIKCAIAAALMGVVVAWSREWILPCFGGTKAGLLLYLLGVAGVGSGLYFALLALLRVEELKAFFKLLRRKRSGR